MWREEGALEGLGWSMEVSGVLTALGSSSGLPWECWQRSRHAPSLCKRLMIVAAQGCLENKSAGC